MRFLRPRRRDEASDLLDGLGLEEQAEVSADDGVEAGIVPHGLGLTRTLTCAVIIITAIDTAFLPRKVGRQQVEGIG